nr:glutaredoxin family protein [Gloeocapsa sp. PCC 73106]
MTLILYSKPGCHLCEGLIEKLNEIQTLKLDLETRDITTNPDWFNRYQYEIPVLYLKQGDQELLIPRFSPRTPVSKIAEILLKFI